MTSPPLTLNIAHESIELLNASHCASYLASFRGMQHRLSSYLRQPIAFAHRGAKAHAAENTLAAFALAIRLGATGLESDVWLTADGIPVLEHDGVAKIGRKKRPIVELRREQLPADIPTLAELVATHAVTPFSLSLDLKGPVSGEAVIEVVKAVAPSLLPDLWLCHPDRSVLVDLRAKDQVVKLVRSTRLASLKDGPEREAAALRELGIDCLNLHHSEWTGGLMALFHRFERCCFAWDLQQDYQLANLLRMGADGVYSDWVDRMMEVMTRDVFA